MSQTEAQKRKNIKLEYINNMLNRDQLGEEHEFKNINKAIFFSKKHLPNCKQKKNCKCPTTPNHAKQDADPLWASQKNGRQGHHRPYQVQQSVSSWKKEPMSMKEQNNLLLMHTL